MGILTSASSASVSRGYDYYIDGRVDSVNQLSDCEYEGYVNGSLDYPYHVKINTKHPRKSYCDCPYADGNITCKHMVALYFEVFPDEADECDDFFDDEYDDFYDEEDSFFEKPLFFDRVLKKYINSLSVHELRRVLLTEFNVDEERTFNLYLKDIYKKYLQDNGDDLMFLDDLNKRINDLTKDYDFNYKNFDIEILSDEEKEKIEKLYLRDDLRDEIDKLLFNEELSVYSSFKWCVDFYKKNKDLDKINDFCYALENYFIKLKSCFIKSSVSKSNVLIAIYLLKDYSVKDCAYSLFVNSRYLDYVKYVINNYDDIYELYNVYIGIIDKNHFKNKSYIPSVLHEFVDATNYENDEIVFSYELYSFICLGDIEYLKMLSSFEEKEKIISIIEDKTRDVFLLIKLYRYYDEKDKLWNLLDNNKYKYLLINNVDILKCKYNDQLYSYFIDEFYNILSTGKNRSIYNSASKYIGAIYRLNDGSSLVSNIISDLRVSEYKKCFALFDEIDDVINREIE